MTSPPIPADARELLAPVAARAARLGLAVYVVGGCVRDWLLGRRTYDIDVVAEGDPAALARDCARRLGGRVESFGQFGTLRLLSPGKLRLDFATARREGYPSPASLPVVSRPAPIAEDLRRRDFTINAMAAPLRPERLGDLIDPFGGAGDLRRGLVRLLHEESFRDDPTRVFRAARYLCRFSFRPAPGLTALARRALADGHAVLLSRTRLAHELLRVLAEDEPACALATLKRWRYLELVAPQLRPPPPSLRGVEERLAGMALALGPEGGERLLAALPVERALLAPAHEALRVARQRRAPRRALSAAAAAALRAAFPRLSPRALAPVPLRGGDLKALGLTPGPLFHRLLDEAARLQWLGRLKTAVQSRAWLRTEVGKAGRSPR